MAYATHYGLTDLRPHIPVAARAWPIVLLEVFSLLFHFSFIISFSFLFSSLLFLFSAYFFSISVYSLGF